MPKLNSIHSPNVELVDPPAILFMKKAHRRVLMKKIGLVSTRPTRPTPTPTTTTTTTNGGSATTATARSSSSREEDFAVNAATLRAKYMAVVEKQKENRIKNNVAFDESATSSSSSSSPTSTTTARDEGTWDDVYSIMDDLSTRYMTMDTTQMDGGTCGDREERRKELIRLKELKRGLLLTTTTTSSSSSSNVDAAVATMGNDEDRRGYSDFMVDDLSKRYSTMDHNAMLLMPNRETRDKELRRLLELNDLLPGANKAVVVASPPRVNLPPWNSSSNNNNNNNNNINGQVKDIIMDDLSARYSSLDNVKMALDGGHKDKQLRRLREIKKAFVQRHSRKKEFDDASYLSDNLTKWYDSTKGRSAVTIVNNVNSSSKETRRLEDMKRKAQEVELNAARLDYLSSSGKIQEEEPLRLDLLKRKQTENDSNYDRKERMHLESLASIIEKKQNTTRIMDLQRLVATRLSAEENNTSARQSMVQPTIQVNTNEQNGKYRPRKSGSVGYASSSEDGTELIYMTNEKGRLDDLEKYLNKRRSNRSVSKTITPRHDGKDGGDDDAQYPTPPIPTPTNRGVRLVSDKLYGVVTELCDLDNEEDCWDITRTPNFDTRTRNSNIDQRKSISSLSTTLPPTNRGVRIVRRDKNSNNNEDIDVELCDLEQDEDCWDITRQPHFDERTRNINVDQRKSIQSLSTTLPRTAPVTSTAASSLPPDRKDVVSRTEEYEASSTLYRRPQSDDLNVLPKNMNVLASSSATSTTRKLPKGSSTPTLSDDDTNYHIISLFPKERPSLLVNTGARRDFTTLGTYDDKRFISGSNRKGMTKSRFKTRDDAPDEQYVDKPRSFQSNLELTSNMSGRRFKTSSDLRYKSNNADIWLMSDIDGMAMTQRSRIVPASSFQQTYSSELDSVVPSRSNNKVSSEEKLMHWLLTHIPDIQEDDAVRYFNCFVEDGFDSIDVSEILEEDLTFMKNIHKQALLQSKDVH